MKIFAILALGLSAISSAQAATLTCGITLDKTSNVIKWEPDAVISSEIINNQASMILGAGPQYSFGLSIHSGKMQIAITDSDGKNIEFEYGALGSTPLYIAFRSPDSKTFYLACYVQ